MLGAVGMDMTQASSSSTSMTTTTTTTAQLGGDIWSTGVFSYDSPIKDLLDTQNYTIEQLLNEDELLQELRGCHPILIQYFSSEASVTKLVQYVIQSQQQQTQYDESNNEDANRSTPIAGNSSSSATTATTAVTEFSPTMNGEVTHTTTSANAVNTKDKQPGEWLRSHLLDMSQTTLESSSSSYYNNNTTTTNNQDPTVLRQIRFPYMACEIICCEIPGIIQTLVEGKCQFSNRSSSSSSAAAAVTSLQQQQQDETNLMNAVHTLDSLEDDDDDGAATNIATTSSLNMVEDEIVTSDSQEDMVEVIAKSTTPTTTATTTTDATKTLLLIETNPNKEQEGKQQQQQKPQEPISILDLLFSLLYVTPVGELDDYRAGYFDKILSVLFRKCPTQLTTYMNSGGIYSRSTLISCMISHLYSHSIMQIAQRLLLPPRPIGQPQHQLEQQQQQEADAVPMESDNEQQLQVENGTEIVAGDDGDIMDGDNNNYGELGGVRCDWSNHPEVLDMLLDTLIGPQPRTAITDPMKEAQILDLSLNASEVLITIIQNSMLSSVTMLSLTSHTTVQRIIDAATTLPDPSYFSPHESIVTSAMNVLESLVLQLGGYGAVGTMTFLPPSDQQQQQLQQHLDEGQQQQSQSIHNNNDAIFDEDPTTQRSDKDSHVKDYIQEIDLSDEMVNTGQEVEMVASGSSDDKHLISDLGALLDFLPQLLDRLSFLLRHPSTALWVSPTQYSKMKPIQLLGNSRLRIVRVLESLVLLGDPDVDNLLVQSNCLEICLDFFWEFQWCSMLHQSVANLLVHVFEGQNTRYEMQKYFLVHCNLLGRLMDSFTSTGDDRNHVVNDGIGGDNDDNVVPSSITTTPNTEEMNTIENIQDVNSLQDIDPSPITTDAPLHISDDDVDAAMEAQADGIGKDDDDDEHGVDPQTLNEETGVTDTTATVPANTIDMISTDAVQGESREISTVGDIQSSLPAQTLRCGYMGHVIIICQALVHAYTNNPNEQETMDNEGVENNIGYNDPEQALERVGSDVKATSSTDAQEGKQVGYDDEEPTGPKDIFGDPLLLFEIVHTHPLVDKWHDFVDTTLATETSIQSTPLGGLSMQNSSSDMMQSYRPGLADEGYMMGDDGEGPPVPPRGMLGGGDMIMMDENDLDIAASLMAGFSVGRPNGSDGDEDHSNNSADSEKSYNSGETANEKVGYAFDDPLGKAAGLGIELGKLTQYTDGGIPPTTGDDDDGSHSSDEDIESRPSSSGEVPVMDLFAGNFNYDQTATPEEFANFAEFDTTGADELRGFPGTDATEPFSVNQVVHDTEVTRPELDDLFGTGDHAELLELDVMPIDDKLSPIKPNNPMTDDGLATSATLIDKVYNIGVQESNDVKVDLFNANTENDNHDDAATENDGGTIPFVVSEIESAPSDELSSYSMESKSQPVENEDI